jgi:non-heme chloroperoxidase
MRSTLIPLLLLIAATASVAAVPDTLFVEVQPGVSVEVLDWGGRGPDVILLAGTGNTAHVYDRFAPLLARHARVRAVTRRGFGASTHSLSGFDQRNMARDIRVVCDSLSVARPVLVGHSLAGSEMAWFAHQWPGRARGMVFLDAAYDHDLVGELDEIAPRPTPQSPVPADLSSDVAIRDWLQRTRGFDTPMSEIHALFRFASDGRLIDSTGSAIAPGHIRQAMVSPPYGKVKAPTLALFTKSTLSARYPARQLFGAEDRKRAEARVRLDRQWMSTQVATFQQRVPHAVVVVRDGANHHLFLTEASGTAMAVGAFLCGLD